MKIQVTEAAIKRCFNLGNLNKFLPELHRDMLGKYSRNFTE